MAKGCKIGRVVAKDLVVCECPLRCAIATRDISMGEEITCNYKYKLEKAPEWYIKSLKNHMKNNMNLKESDIEQIMLKC